MAPKAEQHGSVNVARRMTAHASASPERLAVAAPLGKRIAGRKRLYAQMSFAELENDSNRIASGLNQMGVPRGSRLVLMVRPGIDFISLVFGLLKAGVTMVLIDPGMGRKNIIRCLEEIEPDGFVAIPLAHAIRCLMRRRFPRARHNVTVGRRWFLGGRTLAGLRKLGSPSAFCTETRGEDPAAIIFTTGSTGPPKGVLYRHDVFDRQVAEIADRFQIQPGEIDLPGFPLFGLFNAAMGVSTVIPDMDPTRPADVDPENILEAVNDWKITQSFGSPALWNTVSTYCQLHGKRLPTIRRALSAGAPVPPTVLKRVLDIIHTDGEMHTPYGATEALPVASISGTEVIDETAELTNQGKGVCVGARFPGIRWKVIRIDDGPLSHLDEIEELSPGEIGELMVCGQVVTRQYVTQVEANALHKVTDGEQVWHRMGDVGYLEPAAAGRPERFWFCGRKAHRLEIPTGRMFTIPCEAIINTHPKIYRSALVGVGNRGSQIPVLIAEPLGEHFPRNDAARMVLLGELRELSIAHETTRPIEHFLLHRSLPVDIRHNSKIFREQLVDWAAQRMESSSDAKA